MHIACVTSIAFDTVAPSRRPLHPTPGGKVRRQPNPLADPLNFFRRRPSAQGWGLGVESVPWGRSMVLLTCASLPALGGPFFRIIFSLAAHRLCVRSLPSTCNSKCSLNIIITARTHIATVPRKDIDAGRTAVAAAAAAPPLQPCRTPVPGRKPGRVRSPGSLSIGSQLRVASFAPHAIASTEGRL